MRKTKDQLATDRIRRIRREPKTGYLRPADVAFLVGVTVDALRQAEKCGKLPKPKRDLDGNRCYTLVEAELVYIVYRRTYREMVSFPNRLQQVLGNETELPEYGESKIRLVDWNGWEVGSYSEPLRKDDPA